MLRLLLHPALLSILATLSIWGGVIAYWRSTAQDASLEDILLYMLGLPLLVVGIGFGVRALLRHREATGRSQDASTGEAQSPVSAGDVEEQSLTLALLAAGIATAAGDDATAIHAALKAQEVRPAPDNEIRNRDGFPVVLCRVKDLAFGETETALLQSSNPLPPMALRAVTLLKQSFAPVAEVIRVASVATFGTPDDRSARDTLPSVRLVVDLIVPATWDAPLRRQIAAVANCLLADTGWPDDARVLRTLDIGQCGSALHQIDKFSVNANRDGSPDYYLVLACESEIDQEVVTGLESQDALFGSATPKGKVPGEAAASVLVRRPIDGTPFPSIALIGRAASTSRSKPIDGPGRAGCDELTEAVKTSLEFAKLPADKVVSVFSDIDHHGGRCAECLGTVNALLPHLEPAEHFMAIGQSFGRLDAAGAPVALAVAAGAVSDEEQPVLLVAGLHATERLVMPLLPVQAASV